MLSRLLGGGTFLESEVEAWHLETWGFLLERLGGLEQTTWVLPNRDFFPATEATGHARAEHIFSCVKAAMGMADWPCALEAQADIPVSAQVDQYLFLQTEGAANGTFRIEDGEATITYAPALLKQPWNLVATFAHELAHYLLAPWHDELGDDLHELATDLAVAYAGLGLFGANSAFSFKQQGDAFGQGWSSSRNGYLSPRSWAFALAVFGDLIGLDENVEAHLTREMAAPYRDAVKYLRRKPALLADLRAQAMAASA